MDAMLSSLEKQDTCTPASGLAMILAIIRISLQKNYPNILKKPFKKEYDFIVVGGGTAGCLVASRLSENLKHEVLLVEAGGEEPKITRVPGIAENEALANSSIDWHYWTQPHPQYCGGRPCYLPRGKMMGGCDSHNEMWYLIPNRKLHDEMTERGIEGWSYDEMLPYYKRRSEAREIGEDGGEVDYSIERFPYTDKNFRIVQKAYREMGYSDPSSNGDFNQGYKTTSKHGERISSNRLFMEQIRFNRPNLQVSTETHCVKVVIDPKSKNATGVEIILMQGGKKEQVFVRARKEVIVSCGVINTPQLLQLSGIGPKDLLDELDIEVFKDAPVGLNFQNHPSFSGPTLTLTTTSTVPKKCDVIRKDIHKYVSNKSGPFAGSGAYISYLIFNSSYSTKEFPDLMLALVPSITGMNLFDPGFSMCYYNTLSMRIMATRVVNRGTITIRNDDPFVHPKIHLGYDEKQTHHLARGFVEACKIGNCETFKKYGFKFNIDPDPRCEDEQYGSYEYWLCALEGHMQFWHHGMSSCSMGTKDDPLAVVDNKCKVYGIDGLRIIDASIIPVLPNVNSNAIVLATAERCTDFVKKDHS